VGLYGICMHEKRMFQSPNKLSVSLEIHKSTNARGFQVTL